MQDAPAAGAADGGSAVGSLQQQLLEAEGHSLLEELLDSSRQAEALESSVRDITTLNQMLSSAVAQQAESIEMVYANAVEATHNITSGNKSLQSAITVNKSSRKLVLALLLSAALGLLFFDWFNS